jgi:hypothetical protein
MDAEGPFWYQRAFVADLDIALDPVTEFILASDADAALDRTGHFAILDHWAALLAWTNFS